MGMLDEDGGWPVRCCDIIDSRSAGLFDTIFGRLPPMRGTLPSTALEKLE